MLRIPLGSFPKFHPCNNDAFNPMMRIIFHRYYRFKKHYYRVKSEKILGLSAFNFHAFCSSIHHFFNSKLKCKVQVNNDTFLDKISTLNRHYNERRKVLTPKASKTNINHFSNYTRPSCCGMK